MIGEPLVREFALVRELPSSIIVSKDGFLGEIVLPKREVSFVRLAKRFVEGKGGVKLQRVKVTLPAWLAKDRGIK